MEERYGRPLDWGMLWYTHTPGGWRGGQRPAWLLSIRDWRQGQQHACRRSQRPAAGPLCTPALPPPPADPQLVMKRPMELSCLMAVRNRLAAALAHGEMPALSGARRQGRCAAAVPLPLLCTSAASHLAPLQHTLVEQTSLLQPRHPPRETEDKKACNWCFQSANCALAHKAACGPAATVDSFVRQSTERAGAPLDRWQLELAGKVERAAGHMTPAGAQRWGWWVGLLRLRAVLHSAPSPALPALGSQPLPPLPALPPPADCEFLRKWEDLVGLEEAHATARRPEIWGLTGEERQALGRCMAGLQLAVRVRRVVHGTAGGKGCIRRAPP